MNNRISFTFVLHYYNDIYEFLSRIVRFIEEYYVTILQNNFKSIDVFYDLEDGVNEFGEILPYFLNSIKSEFILSDFKKKDDLIQKIERFIIRNREKIESSDFNTLEVVIIHKLN